MTRRLLVDEAYLLVGQEIRRLRCELGLSQNELARRIGTQPNIVSDIELGLRKADAHLYRLAVVFRVPIKHFTDLVEPCPHCEGSGLRRKIHSRALDLQRALKVARGPTPRQARRATSR